MKADLISAAAAVLGVVSPATVLAQEIPLPIASIQAPEQSFQSKWIVKPAIAGTFGAGFKKSEKEILLLPSDLNFDASQDSGFHITSNPPDSPGVPLGAGNKFDPKGAPIALSLKMSRPMANGKEFTSSFSTYGKFGARAKFSYHF